MSRNEEIIKCEARLRVVRDLRDHIEMAFDDMDKATGQSYFNDGFQFAYGLIQGILDKTLEELSWEDTAAREGI